MFFFTNRIPFFKNYFGKEINMQPNCNILSYIVIHLLFETTDSSFLKFDSTSKQVLRTLAFSSLREAL